MVKFFLNPDFEKILEIAYNNKIKLTANNGVNLNSIKETTIEKIVKFFSRLYAYIRLQAKEMRKKDIIIVEFL